MTAGLQVINSAGLFQIDGIFKSLVLVRIINVTTNEYINSDTPTSQGTVAINSGEIAAIRGDKPCAVTGVSGGVLYLRSTGDKGTVITVYFFAPITTSSATYGLQVFNETTGELVFCATKKPLRFVGFPSGEGDFTYDSTRIYAAIMLTQRYEARSSILGVGSAVFFNENSQRGMVSRINGGIKVSYEIEYVYSRNVNVGQPTPSARPIVTSTNVNLHAIIDVTDY